VGGRCVVGQRSLVALFLRISERQCEAFGMHLRQGSLRFACRLLYPSSLRLARTCGKACFASLVACWIPRRFAWHVPAARLASLRLSPARSLVASLLGISERHERKSARSVACWIPRRFAPRDKRSTRTEKRPFGRLLI